MSVVGTFSIWYLGVYGDPMLFDDGFRRNELRKALDTFRVYAHGCTWRTVWLLKRERKTIARLPSCGAPAICAVSSFSAFPGTGEAAFAALGAAREAAHG